VPFTRLYRGINPNNHNFHLKSMQNWVTAKSANIKMALCGIHCMNRVNSCNALSMTTAQRLSWSYYYY